MKNCERENKAIIIEIFFVTAEKTSQFWKAKKKNDKSVNRHIIVKWRTEKP